MNDTPSSATPSLRTLSMRSAKATLQSPSVGRSTRLEGMQGQRKVQLHVSMNSPEICQAAMVSPPREPKQSG
jgi:hypothetical protein